MNQQNQKLEIILKRIKPLTIVLGGGAICALLLQAVLSYTITTTTALKSVGQKNLTASAVDAFGSFTLEAKAAYVLDIKSQEVLFAMNENNKLPLASITKLMTALVARDTLPESSLLVLTSGDLDAEGDSGLRIGERWRLEDLLDTMLIISSNDAAHAVSRFIGANGQLVPASAESAARASFIQTMNTKAQSLGLTQMEFFNESGLDIDGVIPKNGLLATSFATAGGYGSAHDVAVLFEELWMKYPSTIEITALPAARIVSQDNIAHVLPNTDGAIGKFSGLIASKTGYTTLAGGNLAIIFDRGINDPVVAVVLGSTAEGRFDDMVKLVNAAGVTNSVQK